MRRAVNDLLGAYDKLIMDPVHGGIPLYRHEIQVIDHPLFQRLRNICQNDILSLVFPGATHSRFLHSVGVMHVGTRMFRSMEPIAVSLGWYRPKYHEPVSYTHLTLPTNREV